MPEKLSEEEIVKLAKQRVEAKRGFFTHLAIYVCINIALFLMWFFVSGGPTGYPWFLWVIFGWGIGVVANAIAVFVTPRGSDWERRQIEKEIENIKKS